VLGIFIDVLVPVFAVVGAGFVIARTVGGKPETLAVLAYWVLGPAFIFDVLATTDLEGVVVGKVVGATALTMVLVGGLASSAGRLTGAGLPLMGATVMTSIFGNVGNFGLAISAFALGDDVLPMAGVVFVTVNTLGILSGVGLAELRKGSVARAVKTAFLSPLALAVIPAFLVNINDVELPLWLDRPIGLMAAAMIPVMLLTLGIQLGRMPKALPQRVVATPIAIKLVVSPLVAFVAVALLGLAGVAGDVVILQAAMPAAVFTSLIALEHDLEADFVTSVVLSGTLVSVVTLPVVIALL
jgi:predicted permease